MYESEEISRLFVELQVLKRIQARTPAQSISDAIILVQREISHRTQMAPQGAKITLSREFFDFPSVPKFYIGQAVFAGKEEGFIGGILLSPAREWEYYFYPFSESKKGSLKGYVFLESELIPLAMPSELPPLPEIYLKAIEKLETRFDLLKAGSEYQSEEEVYKAS